MSPTTYRALRAIAIATGIGLPTLSLVPFGGVWLYQNGYVLPWAIGMLAIVSATAAFEWKWLGVARREHEQLGSSHSIAYRAEVPDESWSQDERRAWIEVQRIAQCVRPNRLSTRDDILALGIETIRTVAEVLHKGRRDPHLQFTLPEVLTIVEQVSRRLNAFVSENIPLGDRLTLAHAMTLYRWRGAVDVAERVYDVWRLIRLANPVTAATYELRERLSRQLYEWGRDHVIGRVAEAYVLEIGRAAIDLYGNRMDAYRHPQVSTLATAEGTQAEPEASTPQGVESQWQALWSQTRRAGRSISGMFFPPRRR